MSMLDMIPEREEKPANTTVYQTIVKPQRIKNVSREALVNGVLIAIVAVLLLGILATYFVEDLPDVVVDIRKVSKQALWVFIGGYAIGELLKIVFVNRARTSTEYKDAKSEAATALAEIVAQKKSDKINEYCEWYERTLYESNQKLALSGSNISFETFQEKYMALSKKEISAKYPQDALTKAQFKAIKRANKVKMEKYDPEFLLSTQDSLAQRVPSKRFNARERNITNTILSAVFGAVSSLFCISFVSEIIFNMSKEILLSALVKLVVLTLCVALKLIFANSIVFDTEIGRFELQKTEAKAYLRWYDEASQ